jgi:hypothetical protein
MNQREKLQAQLEILQEMKSDFSRNLIVPYLEDYAGLETERDSGILAVSVYCNQKEFEERLDGNIFIYFSDFESELEEKLEKAEQEEMKEISTQDQIQDAINEGKSFPTDLLK